MYSIRRDMPLILTGWRSDAHQNKKLDREMSRLLLEEDMAEIDHSAGASVLRRRGVLGDCRPVQGVPSWGRTSCICRCDPRTVEGLPRQGYGSSSSSTGYCLPGYCSSATCRNLSELDWVGRVSRDWPWLLEKLQAQSFFLPLGDRCGGGVQVAASWWTARSAPVLDGLLALVLSLVIL